MKQGRIVRSSNQTVLTTDTFRLYHYQGCVPDAPPVLIVFSMINTPDILDMHPKRSFIQQLLAAGLSVYVMGWCVEPILHQQRPLARYILEDIPLAMETICQKENLAKIPVMGICQGGYFALCLNALKPSLFLCLIPVVTPVDFHQPGCTLNQLDVFAPVLPMLSNLPFISGEWLSFLLHSLNCEKVKEIKQAAWENSQSDQESQAIFYSIEKWSRYTPDQPMRAIRDFVQSAMMENALIKKQLSLNGQLVDLKQITNPILNVIAENDHFWSKETPGALANYHGAHHYETLYYEGGHIGVLVGEKSLQKTPLVISRFIHRILGLEPIMSNEWDMSLCKPV